MRACVLALIVGWVCGPAAVAQPAGGQTQHAERTGPSFEVADTLRITAGDAEKDGVVDDAARALLDAVVWMPGKFTVQRRTVPGQPHAEELRFPSPRPSGDAARDTVVLRWFPARGVEENEAVPAVLLLHSIHPQMVIAQAFARGLSAEGVHAFVMEMPGFGHRRMWGEAMPGVVAVMHSAQGVADARRAGDVIAALPGVDAGRLVIQGSSLGGFAAAVTAELDARFSDAFIFLAGGDVLGVVMHGRKDAAVLREALVAEGVTREQLAVVTRVVEPLTLASRLNPDTTWLVSARHDEIVSPDRAEKLADAVGLDDRHHVWLEANHYTAIFSLPAVIDLLHRVAVGEAGGEGVESPEKPGDSAAP